MRTRAAGQAGSWAVLGVGSMAAAEGLGDVLVHGESRLEVGRDDGHGRGLADAVVKAESMALLSVAGAQACKGSHGRSRRQELDGPCTRKGVE